MTIYVILVGEQWDRGVANAFSVKKEADKYVKNFGGMICEFEDGKCPEPLHVRAYVDYLGEVVKIETLDEPQSEQEPETNPVPLCSRSQKHFKGWPCRYDRGSASIYGISALGTNEKDAIRNGMRRWLTMNIKIEGNRKPNPNWK